MLLPPLARLAGLGEIGFHGLLITPEHGPRVRLAAVFTSVVNLPKATRDTHGWVREYCASCRICVARCPGRAIRDNPASMPHGRLKHVQDESCFPVFLDEFGCSICVKVCPFAQTSYQRLREAHWKISREDEKGTQ